MVALNLVLLGTIAYFAARITTGTVAARFERRTQGAPAATAPVAATGSLQPESAYSVVYERDVFNAGKGAPVERNATDTTKRTDLNVKLWGTAIAANPNNSYAIIEDQAGRRQSLYQVGDMILDTATLRRVEWDRVVLERNGEEEVLELASNRPAGSSSAASAAGAPGAVPGERIRKTADDKFVIDRREVEKTVANLNEVFTQARAVPYFEDGKTVGFRVFSIKPGSVFEKIGLQNGDVIQRVNGVELTDPTKAITLFTELQNEGHIAVDLQRNKAKKSFAYDIR